MKMGNGSGHEKQRQLTRLPTRHDAFAGMLLRLGFEDVGYDLLLGRDTPDVVLRWLRDFPEATPERDACIEALEWLKLADAGDPVARALVNAPVVEGAPDPNEPQVGDLRPEDCVPHEVVLQRLLDRAAAEHDALTEQIERLTSERDRAASDANMLANRDADWQRATGHDSPNDFLTTHAWSDE